MPVYLFVGLGNPGRTYEKTRHNLGFMVLDRLAERWNGRFKTGFGPYDFFQAKAAGGTVLLVKPTTFMNRSGAAVQDAVRRYEVTLSSVIVVCDDFNLPLGALRLRPKGSDGGHNGLASVIQSLGTSDFGRLRLGIGLQPRADVVDYVLSRFPRKEQAAVETLVEDGSEALIAAAENGLDWAMNRYNRGIPE
jgi:peptidyl-tRNA hydrolase, PTH1 family